MSINELNQKYFHVIEEGFGGVESNFSEITIYLDRLLRLLIHRRPDFKLIQLKMKFGEVCLYTNLHIIHNDDDRQRDHDLSMKIQSRLQESSKLN